MPSQTPKRLLVIAIRAIGDVVLITPLIRQLRNTYPEAYLAAVADGPSAQILLNNPLLDKVFVIDRRSKQPLSMTSKLLKWFQFIFEIQREKFDTVVDLYSGPRSALLAWLSMAADRYGEDFRSRIRGLLYNHSVPIFRNQRHLIEQKFDVIQSLVGKVDVHATQLELFMSEEEVQRGCALLSDEEGLPHRIVGLVPGAGSRWRIWPAERFAELADVIAEQYHAKIVLVGGEHDQVLCQYISELMKKQPLNLSGKTSLRELMAILGELDLVIANVTGPMHIASAFSKPRVIGLYGAADTIQYAPWSNRATMITKGKPEEAYWRKVDYERDYQRLLEVTVTDVVDHIPMVMKEWAS